MSSITSVNVLLTFALQRLVQAIGRQCYLLHDEPWTDKWGAAHPAGLAVEGPDFREQVFSIFFQWQKLIGKLDPLVGNNVEWSNLDSLTHRYGNSPGYLI